MTTIFYQLKERSPEQDNHDYIVKVDFDFKILTWKASGAGIAKPGFYRKTNRGTFRLVYAPGDDSVEWANIPTIYNSPDAVCLRDLLLGCQLLKTARVEKDYLQSQLLGLLDCEGSTFESCALVIQHSYMSDLKALLCFIILVEFNILAEEIDPVKKQDARMHLDNNESEPINELIDSIFDKIELVQRLKEQIHQDAVEILTVARIFALLLILSSFDRLSDYKKDLAKHGKSLIDIAFSHVETDQIPYDDMIGILFVSLYKSNQSVAPLLLYRIRTACHMLQLECPSIIIVSDFLEQARKMLVLFGSVLNIKCPDYQALYGESFNYSCEPVMDKNGVYVLPLLGVDVRGNCVFFNSRKHDWLEYDYHFFDRKSCEKYTIKKWQIMRINPYADYIDKGIYSVPDYGEDPCSHEIRYYDARYDRWDPIHGVFYAQELVDPCAKKEFEINTQQKREIILDYYKPLF